MAQTLRQQAFTSLKDFLRGIYVANNDVVIVAVKKWLSEAGSNFYGREMQALV